MTSFPSCAAALVLIAVPNFSCSCSDGEEAPSASVRTIDLLARGPHLVVAQPGRIVPAAEEGGSGPWGPRDRGGWQGRVRGEGSDRWVWTWQRIARLDLPATAPRDRELRLKLRAPALPPKSAPCRVTVRLNGIPLRTIEIDSTLTTREIPTHADLWRMGSNSLELEVDELRRQKGESKPVGLALAEVDYDEERVVRLAPPGERPPARMDPGTAMVWRLDASRPLELSVSGRTGTGSEDARLAVACAYFDPADEAVRDPEDPPLNVLVEDGSVQGELPFEARPGRALELCLEWSGPGFLDLERAEIATSGEPPPPVIFVSIDTLAARHMSLYGYERPTTPHLDHLARESIVFERCAANAPWTLPSYMSVMTGMYPSSFRREYEALGTDAELWQMWHLSDRRWTLAEMLRSAGYRTAGFVDNIWLTEKFGLRQGFEHYDTSAAEIPKEQEGSGIDHILPRADEWLAGMDPTEPFFLFVHAFDVHAPYLPGEPWQGTYREGQESQPETLVPAGSMNNTYASLALSTARSLVPEGDVPPFMPVEPFAAAYDEEIQELDVALGRWIEDLRRRGILDRAIFVFAADHGESTMQHSYFGHGTLYEEVVHVPLLVRLPGGEGGGRRVRTSVQLVDIYPTLAELAGVGALFPQLHGRSIAAALRGEELPPAATVSEGGVMQQMCVELDGWKLHVQFPGQLSPLATMLTNPRLPAAWVREHAPQVQGKAVTPQLLREVLAAQEDRAAFEASLREALAGPFVELYYLPDDPGETRDLSQGNGAKGGELMRELSRARRLWDRAYLGSQSDLPTVELSEQELEELRRVGYVDED